MPVIGISAPGHRRMLHALSQHFAVGSRKVASPKGSTLQSNSDGASLRVTQLFERHALRRAGALAYPNACPAQGRAHLLGHCSLSCIA